MEAAVIFLAGLALGSFLSVVTYRLPRGKTFVKGRSLCPHCGAKIKWHDNIPLASFLLLKGRCRNCRKKISKRYPLIELGVGAGFLLIYFLSSPYPLLVAVLFLLALAVFVIDLEHKIIPDEIIFLGFFLVTLFLIFRETSDFYPRLWGGFSSALFLLLVNLVTKGRGMGLGDVKFALLPGTFLGWPTSVTWLFLSFLTGASLGVILILLGKSRLGKQIPFGPFLAFSFIVTVFFGKVLSKWVLGI